VTRHLPLVVATGVTALVLTLPAKAEPPAITAKRAQAARVLSDLRVLDERLERDVEAYNLARIKLAATGRALETNRHHLGVASRNLTSAQWRIAARLVYLYTTEQPASSLAVILGSSSLDEVLDRLDTAQRVANQDEVILGQVRHFRESVLRERQALRRERDQRRQFAEALASRRAMIEAQLTERQRLLTSIKDQIAGLEAKERAQQAELRRQAEARLTAERAAADARDAAGPENDPEPGLGVAAVTPDGVGVAPDTRHGHVVPIAMQYLGIPYLWGGASPSTGFDCSGFVMYVYAQVGVSLPHNAAMQYQYGIPVAKEDLQPGDIVFFNNLGHDGIYIGGGQFIQAPRTGDVVKISSLSEPWYAAGYVGARRLP